MTLDQSVAALFGVGLGGCYAVARLWGLVRTMLGGRP